MSPSDLAVLVAVIGVPLNWYVTWRLWRLARANPEIQVIRDRAVSATALAVVVTVFALIFLNNDLVPPAVSFDATKWLTRSVMLAAAIVPPVYWLWLYRRA